MDYFLVVVILKNTVRVCVCILVSRLMTDKRFAAAPTVKQRGGHSRKACDFHTSSVGEDTRIRKEAQVKFGETWR